MGIAKIKYVSDIKKLTASKSLTYNVRKLELFIKELTPVFNTTDEYRSRTLTFKF